MAIMTRLATQRDRLLFTFPVGGTAAAYNVDTSRSSRLGT
jgi:hypothetical protein